VDKLKSFLEITQYLKEHGIFEIALLIGAFFMISFAILWYRRDQKDLKEWMTHQDTERDGIKDEISKHIKEEPVILQAIVDGFTKAIDGITHKMHDVQLILAKKHLTKADLYNEDWKDVITRIEETTRVTFNQLKKETCRKTGKECTGLCRTNFIAELGRRRRDSFEIWEKQAIPRRILNVIEEVDKMLNPRELQYVDEIITTCNEDELSNKERKIILDAKCNQYRDIFVAEWKELFIEKINFRG
jgi:hypothetical protein